MSTRRESTLPTTAATPTAATPTAALREAPVPLLDLDAQNRPLRTELEQAFRRVLESGRYILGPEVAAFEREVAAFCGVPHAVGVSSGSDAVLAILMAAGVGAGAEVVTTPFTFFATSGAILRLGARPVFADIEPDSLNLDPQKAFAQIGPRTAAVLTVHLFGRRAPVDHLAEACRVRGIPLVEDAAQALGGAPLAGTAAALSFFPAKPLGGFGDGGMVTTRDPDFADRVRLLRTHGAREKHRHLAVGGNFRLDEIQAALLRVKLPHLPRWLAARRNLAAQYREALADTPLRLPPWDAASAWSLFVVRVPDGRRDALADHLRCQGIETAVHYPTPLHLQPALQNFGYRAGDFPVAEQAAAEVLALPLYPELSGEQLARVATEIRRYYGLG